MTSINLDWGELSFSTSALQILHKLEDLNRQGNFWNVSRQIGILLASLVQIFETETVLEIGTSTGYSGIFFAESLRTLHENNHNTKPQLYTVESHAERFKLAQKHFAEANLTNLITQIKGHAPEILEEALPLNLTFDMIFLDATKMEYPQYFEQVLPRLKSGGLLIADNVVSHAKDLQPFLKIFKDGKRDQHNTKTSFILPIDSGLLFYCKE